MSYIVRFQHKALLEYYDAIEWYEEQRNGLGERLKTEVKGKIQLIANNPDIYAKTRGNRQQAPLNVFPFVISFNVIKDKNLIVILAIFHTSRNPKDKIRKNYKF